MKSSDYTLMAIVCSLVAIATGIAIYTSIRVGRLENKVEDAIIDQTKCLRADSIKLHQIHISVDSLGIKLKSKGYLKQ